MVEISGSFGPDDLADRLLGGVLGLRVDRGLDGQPAALDHVLPILDRLAEARHRQQAAVDVVAEERVPGADAAVASALDVIRVVLLLLRRCGLLRGDHLHLGRSHPVEHHVATVHRRTQVVGRVVGIRVLHQAGQHRGLSQIEILGALVEVVLGGGLDPVRPVAVVGDVQVALQDLVLAEPLLQRDRVPQLADLALVALGAGRPGGVQHTLLVALALLDLDHLHVLLGDRGAALGLRRRRSCGPAPAACRAGRGHRARRTGDPRSPAGPGASPERSCPASRRSGSRRRSTRGPCRCPSAPWTGWAGSGSRARPAGCPARRRPPCC